MAIDPRFDTEAGGLSNYSGTVVDAYFKEGDYGWSLVLKNKLDNPELHPSIEDGEFTEMLGCGSKFTSVNGGDDIAHTENASRKYNDASQMGCFLNGQKGKASYSDEPYTGIVGLPGFLEAIPAEFSAYHAKSFVGLHLEWDQVEYPIRRMGKVPVIGPDGNAVMDVSKNPPAPMMADTGTWEEGTNTRRMPVKFLGMGASSVPASSNGHSASASGDFAFIATMDPSLKGQVKAAAATSNTADEFLASVVGITGALANADLAQAIANKDQFAALKQALVTS